MAALASFLDARKHGGQWLVRIEDLDPPRESRGAATQILRTLDALGLCWDGEVVYQSNRHRAYADALSQLENNDRTFQCTCSRQELQEHGKVYAGTCRQRVAAGASPHSIRCKIEQQTVCFVDSIQGQYCQQLASDVGDFIIKRKDGLFAYQLAVVIDDAWQEITHVVRGIDILESTPRQIYLQQLLDLRTPAYGHIPVLVGADGTKLSKQTGAHPVSLHQPAATLVKALNHLQQLPPQELAACSVPEVLDWAIGNWNPSFLYLKTAVLN